MAGGTPYGRAVRRAISAYEGARPTGYVGPEDLAYAERIRLRGTRALASTAEALGAESRRRYAQLGLSYSPAAMASQRRLNADLLEQQAEVGRGAEDWLSQLRYGREAFERQRLSDVFAARLGLARDQQQYRSAQNAAFLNSLLGLASDVAPFFRGRSRGGRGGPPPGELSP